MLASRSGDGPAAWHCSMVMALRYALFSPAHGCQVCAGQCQQLHMDVKGVLLSSAVTWVTLRSIVRQSLPSDE